MSLSLKAILHLERLHRQKKKKKITVSSFLGWWVSWQHVKYPWRVDSGHYASEF